jgi:SAM-dependent methyltransferase
MSTAAAPLPLILGSDQQFRALKAALETAGYTESAVCERAGIRELHDFKTLQEGRPGGAEIHDALDALIRLLMDGEVLPRAELVRCLGEETVLELTGLGVTTTTTAGEVYAEVVLYPQAGLYIVSDRNRRLGIAGQELPADVVYASITKNTMRFLRLIPPDPCEALLDLCSGTGIAALIGAAQYARHAWACDLSGRATHFAEFNARLNGLPNVTTAQGDLYGPVAGRTFDRIVAHPPYVPAQGDRRLLFRDGGEDGEEILRNIVAGLPDYLQPGGACYIVTAATDREGETFEERVRKWLDSRADEFDVFLLINYTAARPGPAQKVYEEVKATALLHALLVIERRAEPCTPITVRRLKAPDAGSKTVHWFLEWHHAARQPGFRSSLLDVPVRIAPTFQLLVVHSVQEGMLTPVEFHLKTDFPFRSEAQSQPWVALLLEACDGVRTGSEVLEHLQRRQTLTAEFDRAEFAEVLERLAENGFIEVPGYELPRAN